MMKINESLVSSLPRGHRYRAPIVRMKKWVPLDDEGPDIRVFWLTSDEIEMKRRYNACVNAVQTSYKPRTTMEKRERETLLAQGTSTTTRGRIIPRPRQSQ
jgi:hypothetical protein